MQHHRNQDPRRSFEQVKPSREEKKDNYILHNRMTLFEMIRAIDDIKYNSGVIFKKACWTIQNEKEQVFTLPNRPAIDTEVDNKLYEKEITSTQQSRLEYCNDKMEAMNLLLSNKFCTPALQSLIIRHPVYAIAQLETTTEDHKKILKDNKIVDTPKVYSDIMNSLATTESTARALENRGVQLWMIVKLIKNLCLNMDSTNAKSTIQRDFDAIRQYKLDVFTFIRYYAEATAMLEVMGVTMTAEMLRDQFIQKLQLDEDQWTKSAIYAQIEVKSDLSIQEVIKIVTRKNNDALRPSILKRNFSASSHSNSYNAAYSVTNTAYSAPNTNDNIHSKKPRFPCRVCKEMHWESDCPVLKKAKEIVQREQETANDA